MSLTSLVLTIANTVAVPLDATMGRVPLLLHPMASVQLFFRQPNVL
jgi:hypothetical protein